MVGFGLPSLFKFGVKDTGFPATLTLLDAITATPLGAYSMRKLSASYSGPAIRVINTNTTVETDVDPGFTKATIDALGSSAYMRVVKWYDQSGNGKDLISQGTHPKLYFGPRPAISFVDQDQTMELSTTGTFNLTAPKIFAVLDPLYGSTHLWTFGSGSYFDLGTHDVGGTGRAGYELNNGSDVSFNHDTLDADGRQLQRGFRQATAWFDTGNDSFRLDAVNIPAIVGANAGDTARNNVELVLGNRLGGTFEGGNTRYSEFILCDGAVTTGDRDIIEASQGSYFLDRKRVVFHGDSLVHGTDFLDLLGREIEENISAKTHDLLGEGWDVYNVGRGGASLDNVSGGYDDLTESAPFVVDEKYRANAQKNICVIWCGFNDSSSKTPAEFMTLLESYCAARQAVGWQVIVVTPPASATVGAYTTWRATVAGLLSDTWYEFADGYADFWADATIGENAVIPATKTFASTDVNTGADTITVTGHGIATGTRILFTTTGTLPAEITSSSVAYYAINVDANTIKVATTQANAIANTAIDLSTAGSGNSTVQDATYWNDTVHMSPDGYALVAPYIEDAITALEDTEAPSVPTSFAAGTPEASSVPFTWAVSTGTPVAYQIRRATDSGFTLNVADTNIAGGATTSGSVTGLTATTLYYFKIRARDAAGNWSAYSTAISATTAEIALIPPGDFGADLHTYLDAEDLALADAATVTAFVNNGYGQDYNNAGTATKQTVNGVKVVRFPSGTHFLQTLASETAPGTPYTLYAIAKAADTTTQGSLIGMNNLDCAVFVNIADGFWESYPAQTDLATVDTANFQIIKNTEGTPTNGFWRIGEGYVGDLSTIVIIDRALTAGEEAGLEAWLQARVDDLNA